MKRIIGLQADFVGWFDSKEMIALLESKDAYVVATVEGKEYLRVPVYSIPTLNLSEWLDLSLNPLPLERVRFDIPAFIVLRYKTEDVRNE